jgi:hypothetical protein
MKDRDFKIASKINNDRRMTALINVLENIEKYNVTFLVGST